VAWNCDVCGEPIHYKKRESDGKIVATRCPLEKYKDVKAYLTQELKFLAGRFHDVPVTNDPEDLSILQNIVPNKTPLTDHMVKRDKVYQLKSLIISGSLRTFYLHFLRFLIDTYGDNSTHFIESHEIATGRQLNYLYLTETLMRDCYFSKNTNKDSKFRSMSDLINPSLLIYGLGEIDTIFMKNKGDILMEVLTSRRSQGKATWILHTKAFADCEEIQTSENLRLYLANSSYIPRIHLDDTEEDPEVFASPVTGTSTGSSGRRTSGRAKSGVTTAGKGDDPYGLL